MANSVEGLLAYWPILLPAVLIQLGLMVAALIHLARHKKVRLVNRWVWLIIIIVINTLGPILYFVLGRSDEEEDQ